MEKGDPATSTCLFLKLSHRRLSRGFSWLNRPGRYLPPCLGMTGLDERDVVIKLLIEDIATLPLVGSSAVAGILNRVIETGYASLEIPSEPQYGLST